MEELANRVKEIIDTVLLIQDRKLSTSYSEVEIHERYDTLIVLVANFNSFAYALKESNPSLAETIDEELKRVDSLSYGAFSFLEDLLMRKAIDIDLPGIGMESIPINVPQTSTATASNEPQPGSAIETNAPQTSSAIATVPTQTSSATAAVSTQTSSVTGTVPKPKRPTSLKLRLPQASKFESQSQPEKKVEFNQDVMQSIITQISAEFARMINQVSVVFPLADSDPEQPTEEPLLGDEGPTLSAHHPADKEKPTDDVFLP